MNVSIIIPFYDEEENVDFVINEIREKNPNAEIIAVDDGSTDKTLEKLKKHEGIKLISFENNKGKGYAICDGFKAASHEICVTIDGDGQYNPGDIPLLVNYLGQADLVCGFRHERQDRKTSIIVSRIANFVRRAILKDGVKDTACGLKVLRKSQTHLLHPFEGTHRFIPAFFTHAKLRIIEVPIRHRSRFTGKTKYTHICRAWRGLIDIFRVKLILSRRNK
jgi:dolichol-phosphate mannosyltransferase